MAIVAVVVLAGCEADDALEPTPEALIEGVAAGVCPGNHLSPGETVSSDWGTATGVDRGVNYEVSTSWTVTICSKGGPGYNSAEVTGPAEGFLQTPVNVGGQIPALSHFSVTGIASTEPLPPTTTSQATTTTEAAATTLPEPGEDTTTTDSDEPTTTESSETTLSQAGEATTTNPTDQTTVAATTNTTTADDTTVPGAEEGEGTVTTGAVGGTSTSSDTDETLANTGPAGAIGLSYLIVVGVVLILLGWGVLRRRDE